MTERICGHCGNQLDGFAGIDGVPVCHGEIRDCYRDVTVYGRKMGAEDALIADLYASGNVLVDEIGRLRALLETLVRDPRVPRDAIEDAIARQGLRPARPPD